MSATIGPFWSILERHGDRDALTGPRTSVSYRDLAALADAWAAEARALLPETVACPLVALEFPRSIPAIIAYLGCLRSGWPVILLAEAEADRHSAIHAAFSPNLLVTGPKATPARADPTQAAFCDGLAVLLSTSGTTGASKLVKLSAQNLSANAASIAEYLAIRPDDITLTTLPLHYSYGMSVLHTHLAMGARLIVTDLPLSDPGFVPLAAAQGVTSLALVPTQFDLLQKTGFSETTLPALRYMTQAGGRLDPGVARHFAQRAQQNGWQLFLMYGQTEAAPRMAYLPPELALSHADKIGRAIPGGRLWIEDDKGLEITTPQTPGELVYEGPNVMIGYALSRADLAAGPSNSVLRTGDLAMRTDDGLFQIVGRLSRFVKLNGLRIGLDEVEATLRQEGHPVNVSGDDRGIVLFVQGDPGPLAAQTATRYGLMRGQVRACTLPQPPLLSSGKVDYAQLRRKADDILSTDAAPAPASGLVAALSDILRLPDLNPNLSFRELGGDSLAYLEVELYLTRTNGTAPERWENMPLHLLAAHLDTGRAAPRALSADRPWLAWQSIGTDVVIRVISIFWVILLHTTSIVGGGGAFALSALIGYSLARHQLHALKNGAVSQTLRMMLQPLLIAYFGILCLLALRIDVHWTHFALIANFPAAFHPMPFRILIEPYWFVATYVQVILLISLPFLLRPVRDAVGRDPFRAGWIVTALLTVLTATLPFEDIGARLVRLPHGMLMLAGLGWCVALADTRPRKVAALILIFGTYLLDWRDTGLTVQEAILLTPLLLLVFPRIRLPRLLARGFLELGALSLYIYLLHVPAISFDYYFFKDEAGLFISTALLSTASAFIARGLLRWADRRLRPVLNSPQSGG